MYALSWCKSVILNAMIPLCEPASAQKTGLEHNVWYLVVQGDVDNKTSTSALHGSDATEAHF